MVYDYTVPISKKVNKDFFKKWSPDMAYVLGFFAADGSITLNSRGGQYWTIEIQDKELLEEIREIIQSGHKVGIRFKGDPATHHKMYRLQIGSIDMCDDLNKLGITDNKTHSLSVPYIPKRYFSSFVRGYFDGDGHVWAGIINKERKTPHHIIQTVFTSCSKNFLEVVRIQLKGFNINKGVISKGKGNYYRLTYSIANSLKLYDFMYNKLGLSKLFLQRKKTVFEKYIHTIDKSLRL
jgi:intein-encoded DNA endonuclease-like protein